MSSSVVFATPQRAMQRRAASTRRSSPGAHGPASTTGSAAARTGTSTRVTFETLVRIMSHHQWRLVVSFVTEDAGQDLGTDEVPDLLPVGEIPRAGRADVREDHPGHVARGIAGRDARPETGPHQIRLEKGLDQA